MVSHGGNVAAITNSKIDILRAALTEEDMTDISYRVLDFDADAEYKFNGDEWWPQLTVPVTAKKVDSSKYKYLTLKLTCADAEKIINASAASNVSRSNTTTDDITYGPDGNGNYMPLRIYFTGTDIGTIGVTKPDFENALGAVSDRLKNGETTTVSFKLTNTEKFVSTSVITGINFMVSHSNNVADIVDIPISFSDIRLTAE